MEREVYYIYTNKMSSHLILKDTLKQGLVAVARYLGAVGDNEI